MKKEIILKGGSSAASVVKIGNTVHRTMSTNHHLIHALLMHLEKFHFEYSPRFLGTDDMGREILSFIKGEVPRGKILNMEQIEIAIKILRQFHDLAATSELCQKYETICHNDFAPWNIIFDKNKPVGMIDFDDAAPGSRIEDVAYFIWTFLDLGISKKSDIEQINNIAKLVEVYQLQNKEELANAILHQQNRILKFRKGVVKNEKDFAKKEFSKKAIEKIQLSIRWVKTNQHKIGFHLPNDHA